MSRDLSAIAEFLIIIDNRYLMLFSKLAPSAESYDKTVREAE